MIKNETTIVNDLTSYCDKLSINFRFLNFVTLETLYHQATRDETDRQNTGET